MRLPFLAISNTKKMIRLPKQPVKRTCKRCKKRVSFVVWADDWDAWKSGELLIQDAFWYLTAGEREILISKICGKCFDEMFNIVDNDEE